MLALAAYFVDFGAPVTSMQNLHNDGVGPSAPSQIIASTVPPAGRSRRLSCVGGGSRGRGLSTSTSLSLLEKGTRSRRLRPYTAKSIGGTHDIITADAPDEQVRLIAGDGDRYPLLRQRRC